MKILGIIPAKSISTRVPNKNMRKVNGQTLLSRAMYSAYPCTTVAVCSDSDNVLTYAGVFAKNHLKNYPPMHFVRLPKNLVESTVHLELMIAHVLYELDREGYYDAYIILQPSSPLREQRDVKGAISILTKSGCDSVVSVSPSTQAVYFAGEFSRPPDGIGMVFKPGRDINTRQLSHELPPKVSENGSVYAFTRKHWLATHNRMGGDMRAMIVDDPFGFDVEFEKDLRLVDVILKGFEVEDE